MPDLCIYSDAESDELFEGDIDYRYEHQVSLAREFKQYVSEYSLYPSEKTDAFLFFKNNPQFKNADAYLYHCFLRHFTPKNIIEVGSGNSTRLAIDAITKHKLPTVLNCIEPYPSPQLKSVIGSVNGRFISDYVQNVPFDFFDSLERDDILFIDSSHVAKYKSDVVHILLKIMPRLKPGVLIHFHDIFLPFGYPSSWIVNSNIFWNEAYVLAAFLSGNSMYSVEIGSFSLGYHCSRNGFLLSDNSIDADLLYGGSLWIRKN